ncbi:GroES-like protein [Hypoxylon crocopeplum]|nr:GroES-like protein [Hypoxylon crocopeplum]
MLTNRSIWQDKPGVPGLIRESPIPSQLEDRKLLIRDVAGIVEAAGSTAASKFEVGDQVFGFTINHVFQDYVTLDYTLTAKIPDSLSFCEVSVFPLCITTASVSLFGKNFLSLPFLILEPTSNGKLILVWGGSSAVGSNGIQLAKADGVDMFKETLPATFGEFLTEALTKGLYTIAPMPEVMLAKGLEGIQEALNILKKGVSAKKLVVEST